MGCWFGAPRSEGVGLGFQGLGVLAWGGDLAGGSGFLCVF